MVSVSFFPCSDEDMQSLASLMSLKQSDIGNLDDFSDEEEERRGSTGSATTSPATGRATSAPVQRGLLDAQTAACSLYTNA